MEWQDLMNVNALQVSCIYNVEKYLKSLHTFIEFAILNNTNLVT